jgi:uncharacterized protein YhfF
LSPAVAAFWERFLASGAAPAGARFCDAFAIGGADESADAGAALILSGRKTATSSLLSDYPPGGEPFVGAPSVLLAGGGRPVAVVETVQARRLTLDALDEGLAADDGERDRTLATLRRGLAAYDALDAETPLPCERFRVIWRG